MAYTNHTLLPEALEKWPVAMFARLLPRPWRSSTRSTPASWPRSPDAGPATPTGSGACRSSRKGREPQVRMAYLAMVGSFSVNGVAALHSRLLSEGLFRDFHEMWPEKFNNKTNGVTPRRWLALVQSRASAA